MAGDDGGGSDAKQATDPAEPGPPGPGPGRHRRGDRRSSTRSSKLDPANKFAHYNLGLIAQTAGDDAKAESDYRLAIAVDPNYAPALYNLAILRDKAGAKDEAIDLYTRATKADPKFATAFLNLGLLLFETGKTAEAERGADHGDPAQPGAGVPHPGRRQAQRYLTSASGRRSRPGRRRDDPRPDRQLAADGRRRHASRRPRRRRAPLDPAARPRLANPDWGKLAPLLLVAIAIGFNLFVLRARARAASRTSTTPASTSRWCGGPQHRLELRVARLRRLVPEARARTPAVPPLPEPPAHHRWRDRHRRRRRAHGDVDLLPPALALAALHVPHRPALPVRPLDRRLHRAARAARVVRHRSTATSTAATCGAGNGVWSQLWGMWLFPLALAFTWRAVSRGKGYALAALFLGLTIACHFLTGYFAILLARHLGAHRRRREILRRIGRAAVVGIGGALCRGLGRRPAARRQQVVGAHRVQRRHLLGRLARRPPGHGVALHRRAVRPRALGRCSACSSASARCVCGWRFLRDERARAILCFTVLGLLLFCGRDTIGFAIDLLPGGKDLLLHRFIIPVHLGGLLLAGIGSSWLAQGRVRARQRLAAAAARTSPSASPLLVVGLVVLVPACARARALRRPGRGLDQPAAQCPTATSGRDFTALAEARRTRSAAGASTRARPRAGSQYKVGYVPGYAYLLDADVDAVGFTLRTLGLSDDVETRFDDTNPAHYDLYNVHYVILPSTRSRPVTGEAHRDQGRLVAVVGADDRLPPRRRHDAGDHRGPHQPRPARRRTSSRPTAPAAGRIPVDRVRRRRCRGPDRPGSAGTPPARPPGKVTLQYERPDDGVFGGTVGANRPAVVMLKATYHPRWKVTVDGKPAKTQMLAPSFVGVAVPAGPAHGRVPLRAVPRLLAAVPRSAR